MFQSFFAKSTPTPITSAQPSRIPSAIHIQKHTARSSSSPLPTSSHSPPASSSPLPTSSPPLPTFFPPLYTSKPETTLEKGLQELEYLTSSMGLKDSSTNTLSLFSSDPVTDSASFNEPFQYMNQMLHNGLGWGSSEEQLKKLIQENPVGVREMCQWIQQCVSDLQIDGGIFELQVERIQAALQALSSETESVVAPNIKTISIDEAIQTGPSPPAIHSSLLPEIIELDTEDEWEDDDKLLPSAQSHSSKGKHRTSTPTQIPSHRSCPGYLIDIRDNLPSVSNYPFLLHLSRDVPWKVIISRASATPISDSCQHKPSQIKLTSYTHSSFGPFPCINCQQLHNHNLVMGFHHCALDGAHESTPRKYLSPAQLLGIAKYKPVKITRLKLQALNNERKLVVQNRELAAWKHLAMAIGQNDIPHIRALMAVEIRNGHSVYSMLEKVDHAAQHLYSPKDYQEVDFQHAFLIYKLGGSSDWNETLLASPYTPKAAEMGKNLDISLASIPKQSNIKGVAIAIDEIKIQEQLSHDSILKFKSMAQAGAIQESLVGDEIHLASEVSEPSSMASNGESRWRRTFISMFLCSTLPEDSPLFEFLLDLELFDVLCGKDDMTPDLNWKHVLKHFRNTLLRKKGIVINSVMIAVAILRKHLQAKGMSDAECNSLLCPNDKQDVTLIICLLNALTFLPEAASTDSPTAYLDTKLSLQEHLVHLSHASHLVLALYSKDKGQFIPAQLFFDVRLMVKNMYFSTGKIQVNDPNAKFFLQNLGTDPLEQTGRRLTVKSLQELDSKVTAKHDHINPKSITGDSHVKDIHFQSVWSCGRKSTELDLTTAGVPPPFCDMSTTGGYNMLYPFGLNRMVLGDGEALMDGEELEDDDEWDKDIVPAAKTTAVAQAANNKPDIDNVVAITKPEAAERKFDVRDNENSTEMTVEDPAIIIVQCKSRIFTAVVQVNEILQGSTSLQSIPSHFLHEPNVKVNCQVMQLTLINSSHQPDVNDWHWNGKYLWSAIIQNLPGVSLELLDPDLERSQDDAKLMKDKPTYASRTDELSGIAVLLSEQISKTLHTIPIIKLSPLSSVSCAKQLKIIPKPFAKDGTIVVLALSVSLSSPSQSVFNMWWHTSSMIHT
ncbi:hypothetical protein BT96DRAFT_947614 [Gymnopus androsaceus JB14]|uniref:Uncharacterized protein n=1 Tax=Gymnopus androsaceus JB14 TaxID=1447944 RepID=A0A6A4GRN9_9AGAR|nr:hypothetical protein BT96DRAFT_947614 [Gymnopus androsaceus JB14]